MHYTGVGTLEELVNRYLVDGDETAIEAVVRRTQPRLLRTARRIAPAVADDCVQTAYLSLVHKRGAALAAPVVPWLITAVVRTAYRHRAQQTRRDEIAQRLVSAREIPDPLQGALQAEGARLVRRYVDRLPARLRDAVILHYLEGLSTPDTGLLLGITDANVRVRVQRARALLRTRMPRLAYSLLALPWLLADAGAEAPRLAKPAVVAIVVPLLVAVGWLVAYAWKDERPAPRASGAPQALLPGATVDAPRDAPERPAEVVAGRVVDPDGNPVHDALVVSVPIDHAQPIRPEHVATPARSARTDASGEFTVALEGDTYAWTIFVEASGLSPAVRRHLRSVRDLEIRLEPAAAMTGKVMSPDGAPVVGAALRWHSFWEGIYLTRETTSGQDGRYRLEDLPAPDTFQMNAGAGDTAMLVSAAGRATVAVSVSRSTERNFVLVEGATLRGVVVDGAGHPVAGARILLWSAEFDRNLRVPEKGWMSHPLAHRHLFETRSGDDGSFGFAHVPSSGFHNQMMQEHCLLGASAPGRVSRALDVPAAFPGETKRVELRLVRTVVVHGRVVDETGAPRSGARVRAFVKQRNYLWAQPATSVSEANGTFRIEGLPAVDGLGVGLATARKLLPLTDEDTLDAGTLVSTVRQQPTVDFLVVDSSGAPVWGAAIGNRRTGRHGRCRVPWSGPAPVVVAARGFAPTVTAPLTPPAEVRVVMRPGYTLSGHVHWEDEQPAQGAWVFVYNGDVPLAEAKAARNTRTRKAKLPPLVVYSAVQVAENGVFEFTNLPSGPYHVSASYETFGREAVAAEAEHATSGVLLTLPGPRPVTTRCTVKGTIRDARTGKPVPFFRAYIQRGATPYPLWPTAPGEWNRRNLDAGTYPWWIEPRGYPRYEGSFTVKAGQRELQVDVELDQGATVRGIVKDAPAGAKVRLYEENWEWRGATVAADGTYVVPNLRPGRYLPEVHVVNGDYVDRLALRDTPRVVITNERAVALDLAVVPGGGVDIFVKRQRLPRGATLTIRDERGRLVGGANAALVDRRMGWSKSGWSKWSLPAGRYVARFACSGSKTIERMFTVVAGVQQKIELGEER